MPQRYIIIPHEFIDGDRMYTLYIVILTMTILSIYILQYFIEIKDIIILLIILWTIYRFT